MTLVRILPRNLPHLPLLVGLILIGINTLTRIILLGSTGIELVPIASWPAIFAKGLWFDLAVTLVLLAPLMLYEALLSNRWRSSRWHGVLRLIWL